MTSSIRIRKEARVSIPSYESLGLGLRTCINCQGTYTVLGGSLPLQEVMQAEDEASRHYVRMEELADAAGAWIAEITGAEWGLVTSGSAAALCQLTAACLAGGNPEHIVRLPRTAGLDARVITLGWHRHPFEHAIRMAGVEITAVETLSELQREADKEVCMLTFLGEAAGEGEINLEQMVRVAKSRGIPLVVDAAAERPDRPNRYLKGGADAVIYSGGKCLRGPQNTGLVLGRKDLLRAASLNGNPHIALARPMKVSKESLMGMLAALHIWYLRDHEAEWELWQQMLRTISAEIASIPSVHTEIRMPGRPSNIAPTLSIQWDCQALPISNQEVKRQLAEGQPNIEASLLGEGLSVMPYMMEPGEDRIVGKRLKEIFSRAPVLSDRGSTAEGWDGEEGKVPDVAGSWRVDLQFILGKAAHEMVLKQKGRHLEGRYRGALGQTELTGEVRASSIVFDTTISYEAKTMQYAFEGKIENDTLRGTVDLDEFGKASWRAERIR